MFVTINSFENTPPERRARNGKSWNGGDPKVAQRILKEGNGNCLTSGLSLLYRSSTWLGKPKRNTSHLAPNGGRIERKLCPPLRLLNRGYLVMFSVDPLALANSDSYTHVSMVKYVYWKLALIKPKKGSKYLHTFFLLFFFLLLLLSSGKNESFKVDEIS